MKSDFWHQMSLRVIPPLLVFIIKGWFCTCRVRIHGQGFYQKILSSAKPGICTFWHYSFLFTVFQMRNESGVVMVSASKDGEYLARTLEKFGFETVRGSRNKGGIAALKGLIRYMHKGHKGHNAAIVADGSQGPARIVQAGSIVLASRVGSPVLPMLWSCKRYIRLNSWDSTAIPYPFSRVDYFYGEPLKVPPKIKTEEIEKYRLILEERLNALYKKAWKLYEKTEH